MKIENIAPYLPYKVNVLVDTKNWFEKREPFIAMLIGIFDFEYLTVKYLDENDATYTDNGDNFKLILRPLSDLTKPCLDGKIPLMELAKYVYPESEDEKFVVTKKGILFEYHEDGNSYIAMYFTFITNEFKIFTVNDKYSNDSCTKSSKPSTKQFQLFQKLFEWHFDVFNLIESGTAININKLN